MKAYISISSVDELEKEAINALEIYEDKQEDLDQDEGEDEDENNEVLFMDEPGDIVLETDELEVEADFPPDEFPSILSFSIDLLDRDDDEGLSAPRSLDSKHMADVVITLKKSWSDPSGKSMALYDVDLD